MSEEKIPQVDRYVHEGMMAMMERANRRLWIALIVVICLFAGYVVYNAQFQDVVITQDSYADGDGSNYLNGTGELITNGK